MVWRRSAYPARPPRRSPGADAPSTVGQILRGHIHFLALAAAVVLVIVGILFAPFFRIKHVSVYGTLFLDPAAVAKAADLVGANPILANTGAAKQRILALGIPRSVSISFAPPDTEVINVVERTPAYIWKVNSTLYLVAENGTVLGPTQRESENVIVVDTDRRPVKPGQKLDARIFQAAARIIAALPKVAGISPRYVTYSQSLGLMVPTSDGIQIVFGDGENLDAKLGEVAPVLKAARAQKSRPKMIDLRFAGHPYFR